jgi:hypothetical protein
MLKERVEAAISIETEMLEDPRYIALHDFYEEMIKQGAVLKKNYGFRAQDVLGSVCGKQVTRSQQTAWMTSDVLPQELVPQ